MNGAYIIKEYTTIAKLSTVQLCLNPSLSIPQSSQPIRAPSQKQACLHETEYMNHRLSVKCDLSVGLSCRHPDL